MKKSIILSSYEFMEKFNTEFKPSKIQYDSHSRESMPSRKRGRESSGKA
ncbi:MAG: hypothetical protein OXJ52_08280 [Oligoflexia bacterium]|nr:hypothetical protein [Oligoflexia bacterium]